MQINHEINEGFTSFFDNCLIDIAGKEIPAVPSVEQVIKSI